MNLAARFIARPVATTLLTLGLVLSGVLGFFLLAVSPLPQVDFPVIQVSASMAGASPETMASSVATPLERYLGQIAGVNEMTSVSSQGSTRVILQFDLSRDINAAARSVQAAINAARADLPVALRSNPTYRKLNPADAPVTILALTSQVRTQGQIYDSATTILQQKLSQIEGVGQVTVGGSSLPAVRVELDPHALTQYGIGFESVRAALAAANANSPKGAIEEDGRRWQLYANDTAETADQYRDLIIAWRSGRAVRLATVAEVSDSVEDTRNAGLANGKPSVLLLVYRQPSANMIATVDRVRALLPELRASVPADIDIAVAMDRTTTIRASLADVEKTLVIAVILVVLVVFLFLRDWRAAIIPSVVVPVSLIGTFGAMYLLGYSLNNLTLMALTIATGFVVDDAIVVLENVNRYVENGMGRVEAAIRGAGEVGFTVLSMSLSLIAVFLPILLMGGIVGRLFREFAVTLSVSILVSLVVSLTLTPMMCAQLLGRGTRRTGRGGFFWRLTARAYRRSLAAAIRHPRATLLLLLATVILNVQLFGAVPKGFMPQQDTGRMIGRVQADQSGSFQAMQGRLARFIEIVKSDPAVDSVVGFTGAGGPGGAGAFVFVQLHPLAQRKISVDGVIARLRPRLTQVPGAVLWLQAVQDLRAGGRSANAQYQYTLLGDSLEELRRWGPRLAEALNKMPELADVSSDQQDRGQEIQLTIDRAAATRLGLSIGKIGNTLYDAFGQRQVSTIFNPNNQYKVVMTVAPRFSQDPAILDDLKISTAAGTPSGSQSTQAIAGTAAAAGSDAEAVRNQATNAIANTGRGGASTGAAVSTSAERMVPLSVVASRTPGATPLSVSHQGHFVAATLSFNLPEGRTLGEAVAAIDRAAAEIGMPATIHGSFGGIARIFQASLSSQPLLIFAAFLAVYIVLGILYESFVHPVTILSTLPSAGVGAVLALLVCDTEFSIIALIGIILLIGIVKKNAIMMIDVALVSQRAGRSAGAAIYRAGLLRFRPIIMTTLVALFGALPLAFGGGEGAELRQPLGIAIVGGLLLSQVLTLYTTPVVYLCLDRMRRRRRAARLITQPAE